MNVSLYSKNINPNNIYIYNACVCVNIKSAGQVKTKDLGENVYFFTHKNNADLCILLYHEQKTYIWHAL